MKNLLLYLFTVSVFTSCQSTTKEFKTIDERVAKALVDNKVPSLSIGVVKNRIAQRFWE